MSQNAEQCGGCSSADIRSWAREAGLPVASRGGISHDVHRAYHQSRAPRRHQPAVRAAGAGLLGAVLLVNPMAGAAVAQPVADPVGSVRLEGAPLVHHFDLDRPGDAVTGEWQVVSTAVTDVPYDGIMTPTGDLSDALARALTVEYGVAGPGGVRWHDAGTIAAPLTYGQAIGRDPAAAAGARTEIPVRVSLADPAAITGTPGQHLEVRTTFALSYLDAGGGQGGGGQGGPDLALTGLGPWFAVLAAVLVALGAVLRRRGGD